ncbi:MAG: PDZ domain-containing protein [Pseudomonadota bacterium]|nr:PDZ domain-containing protein [Pseudomonadota bacterium]
MPLTYWRDNHAQTVTVKIGELKENADGSTTASASGKKSKGKEGGETIVGLNLAPLTAPLRDELGLPQNQEGLAVLGVTEGSQAANAGMRSGDVILSVNGATVHTITDFKKALDEAKKAGRKFALARVLQDKEEAFVALPTEVAKKKYFLSVNLCCIGENNASAMMRILQGGCL